MGFPVFNSPEKSVQALGLAVQYSRIRKNG